MSDMDALSTAVYKSSNESGAGLFKDPLDCTKKLRLVYLLTGCLRRDLTGFSTLKLEVLIWVIGCCSCTISGFRGEGVLFYEYLARASLSRLELLLRKNVICSSDGSTIL